MKFQQGKIIQTFKAGGREITFRFPNMSDADGLRKFIMT